MIGLFGCRVIIFGVPKMAAQRAVLNKYAGYIIIIIV